MRVTHSSAYGINSQRISDERLIEERRLDVFTCSDGSKSHDHRLTLEKRTMGHGTEKVCIQGSIENS